METKTDDIFCEDFRNRYRKDGYSEQEIDQIQKDTIYFRKMYSQKTEQREITSTSYKMSQKRTNKQVSDWFFGNGG